MKIKTTREIINDSTDPVCEFLLSEEHILKQGKWVSVDSLLKWIDEQTPIFDDNCSKGVDIEDLKEALKGQLRP